jgi:hypothetical protein
LRISSHSNLRRGGTSDSLMMVAENEKLTAEDIRYLKVAIALALGSDDIRNMPKTKDALNELYAKLERLYRIEANKE